MVDMICWGISFGRDVDLGIIEDAATPGGISADDFTSPANGMHIVWKLS